MGGSNAKPLPSSKAGYYPDVEVVQAKHIDQHYGEVRYVRDKRTNQLLVLKEIVVNTKQAYDSEADFLHHRVALKHPNVVEIIGFNTVDQSGYCGHSWRLSIYIEVQEKTLQAQLNDRIFNRQAYTEGEITHVAECLISALSYFQNKGHNHGDIRPANIFVKANTIKLSDPTMSNWRNLNSIQLVKLHGHKCFLAPEQLGNIIKATIATTSDKHKADVWSVGVTLLALATLSNCEDLYNYKLGTLNEGLLGERLNQVRAKYSPKLYDLIRSMLTLDERVRPDFATLARALGVVQPASPVQIVKPVVTQPVITHAPVTVSHPVTVTKAPEHAVRSSLPTTLNTPTTHVLHSAPQTYHVPQTQAYTVPQTYHVPQTQAYTVPQTYTQTYAPQTYTLPTNYAYPTTLRASHVIPSTTLATTEVKPTEVKATETVKRSVAPTDAKTTTTTTAPVTTTLPTTTVGTTLPANYGAYSYGTTLPSTYGAYSYPTTTLGASTVLPTTTYGTHTLGTSTVIPTSTVGTTTLKRSLVGTTLPTTTLGTSTVLPATTYAGATYGTSTIGTGYSYGAYPTTTLGTSTVLPTRTSGVWSSGYAYPGYSTGLTTTGYNTVPGSYLSGTTTLPSASVTANATTATATTGATANANTTATPATEKPAAPTATA